MELKLIRSVFKNGITLGKLYVNDTFFGYTAEDMVRHIGGDCSKKIKNETAIDAGTYEVVLNYSQRFNKYLPLLLNVPCFEGIRIHGGNTAADTEGCILVGAEGDMEKSIWNCASKITGIISILKKAEKKEKVWITIIEQ